MRCQVSSTQCMTTHTSKCPQWGTGELIDQLAVTQQAFSYTGLSGPTLPLNQPQPTADATQNLPDDILSKKPEPKNIQYQLPTFSLDRLTQCLAREERIQVHHNYISAISNREHKKDLINRLKRSDPHNIPADEEEMAHHMVMHDDVLGRILTIPKQDDYYRTLEELPVVNNLRAYDNIQLFLKLYDTTTIIERVTGEVLRVLYQNLPPHFSLSHQIHLQRQLLPITQTTHKVLKHRQGVQYPVDNRPPENQQALTVHHLNMHHHSRLCLHNLLHQGHLTQATHPHTLNPTRHHNHLPPHKCTTHHQHPI